MSKQSSMMENLIYEYEKLYNRGKKIDSTHDIYEKMAIIMGTLNKKHKVAVCCFAGYVEFFDMNSILPIYSFKK